MKLSNLYKYAINPSFYLKIFKFLKNNSLYEIIDKATRYMKGNDVVYEEWIKRNTLSEEEISAQSKLKFSYMPKISIVVPVYNTKEFYLKEMIESVLLQSYSNWELCIADASDVASTTKIVNDYAKNENRIKTVKLSKNLGISKNSNKALEIVSGEYVGLLDHDDVLSKDALFEVAKCLQENEHELIYSDEDFINNNSSKRLSPIFKPDWSPDLLRSHNYITHFCVIKKELIERVGGFCHEYDGAQDYDLIFKCTEIAKSICHIPKILYHWRICENSVASDSSNKLYAYEAGKKAIESHLNRVGYDGTVTMLDPLGYYRTQYSISDKPLISVIIPNKDHVEDLNRCIKSFFEINNYKNFEIIICENNSENKKTFDFYDYLKNAYHNIKIVNYKGNFNFSAINNYAVKYALGDYLLFLNNDTKIINPESLFELLTICMHEETGVVGAKLLFKNNTIQHAGVVVGLGGSAQHVFSGLKENDFGYAMRSNIVCNYSAVTGACLMTKKSLFEKADGFSEELSVSFNDIDFCLKIRELGKFVVYNPFSCWYHYESLSRGYDKRGANKVRFEKEKKLFISRWSQYINEGDPFYNKNFKFRDPPYCLTYK